jgi:hypothetical protein
MEVNAKTIIELSEEEVLSIVEDFLKFKGYEVTGIQTSIAIKTTGYYLAEKQTPVFKGITATCKTRI